MGVLKQLYTVFIAVAIFIGVSAGIFSAFIEEFARAATFFSMATFVTVTHQ